MDTGEGDGSAPAVMRPAPLLKVLPQEETRRHTGCGFELVLDLVVPQLGQDVRDWPPTMELVWWEQVWRFKGLPGSVVINWMVADIPSHYAAFQQRARAASGSRSSNKVGGRKKKKRRKKKVPKSSSSHSSRREVGMERRDMHDRAEDEFEREEAATYETVVSDILHAERLNSARSKEVAGDMDEIIKLIQEKVIAGEEIILRNGVPAEDMYSDRTHLYISPSERCWPDWWKNRQQNVRRLGCSRRWTGLLLTSSFGQA